MSRLPLARWLIAVTLLGVGIVGISFIGIRMLFRSDFLEPIGHTEKSILCQSDVQVIIYATESCTYCQQAKELLTQQNLQFLYREIDKSQSAYEEFLTLSGRVYPVILTPLIRVNGFDEGLLTRTTALLKHSDTARAHLCDSYNEAELSS